MQFACCTSQSSTFYKFISYQIKKDTNADLVFQKKAEYQIINQAYNLSTQSFQYIRICKYLYL